MTADTIQKTKRTSYGMQPASTSLVEFKLAIAGAFTLSFGGEFIRIQSLNPNPHIKTL
jgi:hypothetical protein